MAIPQFRDSTVTGRTTSNPYTVSAPAGRVAGDRLLLFAVNSGSSGSLAAPGWDVVHGPTVGSWSGGYPHTSTVLTRVADGSSADDAVVTRTAGGSAMRFAMVAYEPSDIHVSAADGAGSFGSTITAPDVSTSLADTKLVRVWFGYFGGSSTRTFDTVPLTVRVEAESSGTILAVADADNAAIGSVGTSAATTNADVSRTSASIALVAAVSSDAYGALAGSLPLPVVAAEGVYTLTTAGSLAASLPTLTVSASGTAPTPGVLAASLPVLSLSAAGAAPTPGVLAIDLPLLSVSAFGYTPPSRTGYGLALDAVAELTVTPPIDTSGDPVALPLHVIVPTVPAPTLVDGRPS